MHQPIPLVTSIIVIAVALAMLGWIAVEGHWPYLLRKWVTSVDHQRIGVTHTTLARVMLLCGFSDALLMRSHLALAFQSGGYLAPMHFAQILLAHGTITVFFFAMTLMIGLMNFVVPL